MRIQILALRTPIALIVNYEVFGVCMCMNILIILSLLGPRVPGALGLQRISKRRRGGYSKRP